MASVRVAVRLRPFNTREKDMNSTLCIRMEGTQTLITNPDTKEEKTFNFDFSYWSHDGFKEGPDGELIAVTDRYATQRKVYNDLGKDVLDSAFEGYNSTLFAYGQTGSGKSFSMVGYGVNKGIIPIVCEEMFKAVDKAKEDTENIGKKYQVTCTMLEIYNEAVRDLLNPSVNPPGGLKIRSQPGIGVYVEKLTPVAVASYADIERRMEEGTANRTVASTKMNATSSRAHTVFGVNFTTITTVDGANSEVTSRMNLVDLAGSERADSTGATGDRLKEGSAINASLSALGNVISALADISMGKKKVFVPYRNSALTRLLQDALGGNSRTIMICALSPADVNYDETLSTLRYADRAKKIKNKVVKMENATDKIIRMLKEENARLMSLLSSKGIAVPVADGEGGEGGEGGGGGGGGASAEEIEAIKKEHESKLREQMEENERMMKELQKSWEEKLADAQNLRTNIDDSGAVTRAQGVQSNLPYLINLHEDPQMSECVVYMFKRGITKIGRKQADVKQDINLAGLSIANEHAAVEYENGKCVITALNKSKTFVNGDIVKTDTGVELHTGDRVILGNNFVFRFINPEEEALGDNKEKMSRNDVAWADAMDEFSTKQGLRVAQSIGGEMGKLEQEEATKRKELELKLAQMEEEMRKERELARTAMEQQKKIFMARINSGEQISEEEKAQLAQYEEAYNSRSKNLEDEVAKRKEMSEKILQEQMKRKRQTKKIEEKLGKLMPLINEANSMAEELNKPTRFEARLVVKSTNVNLNDLDELRNLKTIDIQIRVTSSENGNVWTWNHTKFDSRLYMMREIYQEFMEYGPREVAKSKDPFWDPPEAVEIGKAYVYLKALSQLVEIENDFAIVDYKGDEQGTLRVEIFPEGINGEDLDYLGSPDELLGQPVTFRVRIPHAHGLPAKYSNDVYVSFAFQDQSKETEACDSKSCNPTWKFEHRFKFDSVSEEFKSYLLKDAAVFEVRGFSDQQINSTEAKEAKEVPKYVAPAKMCNQCEEQPAGWDCKDCSLQFCEGCFALLHKSAKKQGHERVAIDSYGNAISGGDSAVPSAASVSNSSLTSSKCNQCDEQAAVVNCADCQKVLCDGCNALLHKSAKKAEHVRTLITGSSAAPVAPAAAAAAAGTLGAFKCQQCEENGAIVKCTDCDKALCDGCNNLLHKSAKKQGHNRISV